MTLLDLLFLLAVVSSAVTLAASVALLVRSRRVLALNILRNYALCAGAYLAAGLLVSALKPQRVIPMGVPWCFDDWCIDIQALRREPGLSATSYSVDLRIFSAAKLATQRAKGAWIYIIDERGHRYAPDADPRAAPLDIVLRPGEEVTTSRVFHLPSDVHAVGIVTGHGGVYCGVMAFLVVGECGCLFGKPSMMALQ